MSPSRTPPAAIDTLITAAENREMFDRIAARYDAANRFLSLGMDRRWRRLATEALHPVAGGVYLDIGTGTGDVALEIVRQAPEAHVTGIDPSEAMLALARRKAAARKVSGSVAFVAGDALQLPVADGSCDGVISAFCFRNIVDRRHALGAIRRVLKDNGGLVLLELVHPAGRLIHLAYHAYAWLIPALGFLAGDAEAYRYLVRSIAGFPLPDAVEAMLDQAGFSGISHIALCGGVVSIFACRKGAGR